MTASALQLRQESLRPHDPYASVLLKWKKMARIAADQNFGARLDRGGEDVAIIADDLAPRPPLKLGERVGPITQPERPACSQPESSARRRTRATGDSLIRISR